MSDRHKASADGFYVLDGHRFRAKKGELMPPGAEFEAAKAEAKDERAASGPTETMAAKGPAENQAAKAAAEKK